MAESRSGPRRHDRTESGQATVELAVCIPVLVVVVLVVMQILLVARDATALTAAARAAARAAMVGEDPHAAAAHESRLDPARLEIVVSGVDRPGSLVTVSARYRVPTEVPVVGRLSGDVELSERMVVRRE